MESEGEDVGCYPNAEISFAVDPNKAYLQAQVYPLIYWPTIVVRAPDTSSSYQLQVYSQMERVYQPWELAMLS
jgi:hypothetical protein